MKMTQTDSCLIKSFFLYRTYRDCAVKKINNGDTEKAKQTMRMTYKCHAAQDRILKLFLLDKTDVVLNL